MPDRANTTEVLCDDCGAKSWVKEDPESLAVCPKCNSYNYTIID